MSRRRYRLRRRRGTLPAIGVLVAAGFALYAVAAVVSALAFLVFAVCVFLALCATELALAVAYYFVPSSRRPLSQARERVILALRR
jgi:cobalamin biosynthesis protein CobD/CbiB